MNDAIRTASRTDADAALRILEDAWAYWSPEPERPAAGDEAIGGAPYEEAPPLVA
jgi:hypothetical protein